MWTTQQLTEQEIQEKSFFLEFSLILPAPYFSAT